VNRTASDHIHLLTDCSVLDPLKPSGNYIPQLSQLSITLYFVFVRLVWFSLQTAIISLNTFILSDFVMVKCCVIFEGRIEFLNSI
jgi:ABC-type transport system involved in cytochrome bd biosynthesis fused ATPase/permease subunit